MSNEIQLFNNEEFGDVRTVLVNEKVYFVASDVAKALGYKRPNDAVNQHCRHTVKHRIGVNTGTKADGSKAIQMIESATVDTNILIVQNNNNMNHTEAVK